MRRSGSRDWFLTCISASDRDWQTLIGFINGVKVSLFGYSYPLIASPEPFHGIHVAALPDLAAMKLDVITRISSIYSFSSNNKSLNVSTAVSPVSEIISFSFSIFHVPDRGLSYSNPSNSDVDNLPSGSNDPRY